MRTFGVAEAKRRFSELLDRITRGERFVVERRGKPVAALIAPQDVPPQDDPRLRGALALLGALADVEGYEETVREITAARRRAKDRPPPDLE